MREVDWLPYQVVAIAVFIAAVVILTGCERTVYPLVVRAAEKACTDHGGWAQITNDGYYAARCADGKFVSNDELRATK